MKKLLCVISAFLLVFLFTTGIASAGVSFRFFLPPVVIGPPAVAAPPPAYHSYPYGYYGYGPGYGRVWVPGYWERVWTGYSWQRIWHRGHWEYR